MSQVIPPMLGLTEVNIFPPKLSAYRAGVTVLIWAQMPLTIYLASSIEQSKLLF